MTVFTLAVKTTDTQQREHSSRFRRPEALRHHAVGDPLLQPGQIEISRRRTWADVEGVDHLTLAAIELGETDLETTAVEHPEDLSQSPDTV